MLEYHVTKGEDVESADERQDDADEWLECDFLVPASIHRFEALSL